VSSSSACRKKTAVSRPETRAGAVPLPLCGARVPAGFPSPADDFVEDTLDLNTFLVRHPAATFFVRVQGDSMVEAGIHSGDILIVDRALEARDRSVVVAVVDGELTVKRLRRMGRRTFLVAENPAYPALELVPGMDIRVWGVVTHVIHTLSRG